jgi:hypothetical protein
MQFPYPKFPTMPYSLCMRWVFTLLNGQRINKYRCKNEVRQSNTMFLPQQLQCGIPQVDPSQSTWVPQGKLSVPLQSDPPGPVPSAPATQLVTSCEPTNSKCYMYFLHTLTHLMPNTAIAIFVPTVSPCQRFLVHNWCSIPNNYL